MFFSGNKIHDKKASSLIKYYCIRSKLAVFKEFLMFPFKGCVTFVSLFCMSKREKKEFYFHFKSSFRSWDNQILTFQIFKCHHVIKCLSVKHETYFIDTLGTTVWLWNLVGLCNITKEKFLSKSYMKNVTWKTVPGPF